MMSTVLVISALIATVLASPVPQNNSKLDDVLDKIVDAVDSGPELKVEDVLQNNSKVDEVLEKIVQAVDSFIGPELKVEESNVTYWYFSKENPTNGTLLSRESVSTLADTSFNTSRDTIFIVHGWRNSNTSSFLATVRPAILTNMDVNVFVVDWSEIAAQSYMSARNAVPEVGKFLADFIDTLVSTYNLSLSRTTLVGHSLGGQVAGVAGGALNGSVEVIVGLDPALPLFLTSDLADRLDASDAKFVQVVHTNGGLKGFLSPVGDADYYPNGGFEQPGCGSDITGSCAHARAYEYYAESLGGGRFVAVACGSYLEFSSGTCRSGDTSPLGTVRIDKSASGRYYLDTNSESPYSKG